MNKEDILKRSREEKNDEGNWFILNNGNRYGTIFFIIIMLALLALTIFTWRITESALLMTVLWGFLTGQFIGHNKALQNNKKGVVIIVIGFTLVCFITYVNQAFFS